MTGCGIQQSCRIRGEGHLPVEGRLVSLESIVSALREQVLYKGLGPIPTPLILNVPPLPA
jgi:hypothetical protein